MFWRKKKSAETLKDRLQLVLSYDRAQLSPGMVDALKADLVKVLRTYFPGGQDELEVSLEQRGERVVLVANLPVR